jgi:hypothetical protein
MSVEGVVLEEVARRAMDDGLDLVNKGNLNDYEEGMLFAYFNIIDWAKQQAEINGIKFEDKELQEFDAYSLHSVKQAA